MVGMSALVSPALRQLAVSLRNWTSVRTMTGPAVAAVEVVAKAGALPSHSLWRNLQCKATAVKGKH